MHLSENLGNETNVWMNFMDTAHPILLPDQKKLVTHFKQTLGEYQDNSGAEAAIQGWEKKRSSSKNTH